jgi:hypothetical protein
VPRRLFVPIALLALLGAAAPAAARGSSPTRAQIRQAVARAEHSRKLWATVNICNTKHYPKVIGVRGQIPSLGFPASLSMTVGVDYQPTPKIGFKPDPQAKATISLGRSASRLQQGGVRFRFGAHSGPLRGRVTFQWRLGRRLIGSTQRLTTRGHHDADFGDPRRFSAAQCNIP